MNIRIFSILLFFAVAIWNISQAADTPFNGTQPALKKDNGIELKIYPNPVETGKVTLEMKSGEINEIRLIDIAGKEVITRKILSGSAKYQLQLNEVPNGIYFVRIKTSENQIVVRKLVVTSR